MRIKAYSDLPKNNEVHSFPLGSIDNDYIHIGAFALARRGSQGGKINTQQVMDIIHDAIERGACITIGFDNVHIEIE